MKTNKPKVQKKVAKKAAKKDLEKTLTDRILEVVHQLAQDAEKIGVDIKKVGKNVSKELVKRFSSVKETTKKKELSPAPKKEKQKKPVALKAQKVEKTTLPKEVKKAHKAVQKAAGKAKPVTQSVKVVPIVSAEKVEEVITKTAPAAKTKPVTKPAAKPRAAAASRAKKPVIKKGTGKADDNTGLN